MKQLIRTFYDIRKGEWQSAALMFGLHFTLMMTLYFLKPARDSLFLNENGPAQLPFVYMLLAVVSIPVVHLLSGFMRNYRIRSVLLWTFGVLAVNLLLLRWLFVIDARWVYMTFYIWVGIYGILVISLFWLFANAVFNVSQSKRVFSFLTLGAILGAIAGSESSSLIVAFTGFPTEDLLFICAGLLGLAIPMTYFVSEAESTNTTVEQDDSGSKASALDAAKTVFKSRYQLSIAGIVGLTMVATTLTDFQFKTLAFEAYSDKASLTAFLGSFYGGLSFVSLIIQVLFSAQIIKRMGLAGAVLARPAGMLLGAVLVAVHPVLLSIILLNGYDSATRYSIDKTGRELLFLPLSQRVKERIKVFIDIFVDRFSRGFAGLFLLAALYWFGWGVQELAVVVAVIVAAWLVLGYQAKRGYVNMFRRSLQKQYLDSSDLAFNLEAPSVQEVMRESLRSPQPRQILYAMNFIDNGQADKLATELIDLLDHPRSEVRLEAIKVLRDIERPELVEKAQELLSDDHPEVRLETINYLCRHAPRDPQKVIREYLDHEDDRIKSAALGCASKHAEQTTEWLSPDLFDRLLQSDSSDAIVIRAQVAESLGYVSNYVTAMRYLPRLLHDDSYLVVRNAIESIGRQQMEGLIPDLLEMLATSDHNMAIRKALASYGEEHLEYFRDQFLSREVSFEIKKHIPGIFTEVPCQCAVDNLMEMLEHCNPQLRFDVIKALNKLKRKYPKLHYHPPIVSEVIKKEAQFYFELLAVREIQPSDRPNELLISALDEKMEQAVERIFRLAGLKYNARDIYGAYLGLRSQSTEKAASSIEFIDNVLSGLDHKYIFPIVDDLEPPRKVAVGKQLFDIDIQRFDEGLMTLLEGGDRWLKATALYSVSPRCPDRLQQRVAEMADAPDQLLRETARHVLKRNKEYVENHRGAEDAEKL